MRSTQADEAFIQIRLKWSTGYFGVHEEQFSNYRIRGVATGWTGVDMSTPLLPETIPEIDADPASFFGGGELGVANVYVQQLSMFLFAVLPCSLACCLPMIQ